MKTKRGYVFDGVWFSQYGRFYGTCPVCVVGVSDCPVCDGCGELFTGNLDSFPVDKLEELRWDDLCSSEQQDWEDSGER